MPIALISLLLLLTACGTQPEQSAYLPGTNDVPAHDELVIIDEFMTIYDKPSGRIVDLRADTAVEFAEIDQFYADTLPQLGWDESSDDCYLREDEELCILYEDDQVHITLNPL